MLEAMGQLVGCIDGVGEAARALDFPIVSGNVSLYNETSGVGILPTPTIGGVGLVADVAKTASLAFKRAGDAALLIGGAPSWLGCSAYLATICGRDEGAPPPVDLAAERRNGEFVASLIAGGRLSAVHDLSDGGLAVALAEMAIAGGIGATIDGGAVVGPAHAFLFGEDQGRYVVTTKAEDAPAIVAAAAKAGVAAKRIGTTGGGALTLPGEAPIAIATLKQAHETWLPRYMDGPGGELG
jgi:phosphoribosylformylglycinamidine synthase